MTIWAAGPLTIAESHSRTVAVLVDEVDAGRFERASNNLKRRLAMGAVSLLH